MTRVVIVGSGNVAEALARALAGRVVQVWARNAQRGRAVAALCGATWSGEPQALAAADVYLIAVSDRAVAEVAAHLPFAPQAVVAHTAGAVPLNVLPAGCRRAVLYPLQTFTAGVAVDFAQIPLFVEGETAATEQQIEDFARTLSSQVRHADTDIRRRIHLAGVFANNFVNYMYICAADVLRPTGLPFEVLAPIIGETARKAVTSAEPRTVQTGPAVRGDMHSQRLHEALLQEQADLLEIYKLNSQAIWKTSKKE